MRYSPLHSAGADLARSRLKDATMRASTMHAIHFAAILVLISLNAQATQAPRAPSPFCYGEAETTVKVQAFLKAHAGSKLAIMEGDEAVAWMESFNTLPPLSNFVADKIWTVENLPDDTKHFRLAFFVDHETCFNMRMPVAEYVAISEHAKRNNH